MFNELTSAYSCGTCDEEEQFYNIGCQAFSDIRIKSHFENLMLKTIEYFPFLVYYMDTYGKETYDYLNKVTKVTARRRKCQLDKFNVSFTRPISEADS
jgi:hypothetical protein